MGGERRGQRMASWSIRRKPRDHPVTQPVTQPVTLSWSGASRLVTHAATAGLWLAVAAGPAAVVLVLALGGASAPRAASPVAEPSPADTKRLAVEELAMRFVVDWLSTPAGQEDRLGEYGLADQTTRPAVPPEVANPAVAAALDAGTAWSVTVGVDLGTPEDPAEPDAAQRPALRRYFQVAIEEIENVEQGGALAVQALPAPVPGPPTSSRSPLGYPEQAAPGDPAVETVTGFLSALLTGDGNLNRYAAPGRVFRPVAPPPYTVVEVTDLRLSATSGPGPAADGTTVHVLATASVRSGGDATTTVQYPLTLVARAGRWEVDEIAPVPVQRDQPAPDTAQPLPPSRSTPKE